MQCTNPQCGNPDVSGPVCNNCGSSVAAKPKEFPGAGDAKFGGDVGYAEIHQQVTDTSTKNKTTFNEANQVGSNNTTTTTTSNSINEANQVGSNNTTHTITKKETTHIVHGDMHYYPAHEKESKPHIESKPHTTMYFLVAIVGIVALTAIVFLSRSGNRDGSLITASASQAASVNELADNPASTAPVPHNSSPDGQKKLPAAATQIAKKTPPPASSSSSSVASVISGHSTVTVAEGNACTGDHGARDKTRQAAIDDAKRNAVGRSETFLRTRGVKVAGHKGNSPVDSKASAEVRLLGVLHEKWSQETGKGECLAVQIQAEVLSPKTAQSLKNMEPLLADSSGPLVASVWTDKQQYGEGEKIKIHVKGNKPFYARVLYRDASGNLLQLLPNEYRSENYFQGGMVYEIPAGNDRFDLAVTPPFGTENIILYASTRPLGKISVKDVGGVYAVKTSYEDVGVRTRGVQISAKPKSSPEDSSAEFFEGHSQVRTRDN